MRYWRYANVDTFGCRYRTGNCSCRIWWRQPDTITGCCFWTPATVRCSSFRVFRHLYDGRPLSWTHLFANYQICYYWAGDSSPGFRKWKIIMRIDEKVTFCSPIIQYTAASWFFFLPGDYLLPLLPFVYLLTHGSRPRLVATNGQFHSTNDIRLIVMWKKKN